MPTIQLNDHRHTYEQIGEGIPLVFIHGGFVDFDMWAPQVDHFAPSYRVIRYDLRGHGRTGPSALTRYTMATFAGDLLALLEALNISETVLCGLSLGGMVAQAFGVQHPDRLRGLILADTAVSVRLTFSDKLQSDILFPKWAMLFTLRMMSVETFARFSFWLARVTRSEKWFGQDKRTRDYVEGRMLKMDTQEYRKVYEAIYDFDLLPLEKITCPTLVLNGEHESKSVFRHTAEILKRVPNSQAQVIPGAGHTSNLENPAAFNRFVEEFLVGTLDMP